MGNANAIPCVTLLTQICILRYVSALPALPELTHVLTQIALPVLKVGWIAHIAHSQGTSTPVSLEIEMKKKKRLPHQEENGLR